MTLSRSETDWAHRQVKRYRDRRPLYVAYAELLEQLLGWAVRDYDSLAIVQARPKAIGSFAEKIWRKRDKYDDPVNQLTDLCGARVITHTPQDVVGVSEFVKAHFIVDWDNSLDHKDRLEPGEFGYRSVHYIVQLKPGSFPTVDVPVKLPADGDEIYGLTAEIQVRTLLEHAWADIAHILAYKGGFEMPRRWERALKGVAAVLEGADESFSEIRDGLEAYAESYGSYMDPARMREEIARLEIALTYDPENAELAGRIARLANVLADWDRAEQVLEDRAPGVRAIKRGRVARRQRPILRELGNARSMKYGPGSPELALARLSLERAADPPDRDVEALLALARSWRREPGRADEVRRWYQESFHADPSDPFALGGHLEQEIASGPGLSIVVTLSPQLEAAVERCKEQAEVGVNLPEALFELGKFELLLDSQDGHAARTPKREDPLATGPRPAERYRALASYAKAAELSASAWPIKAAFESLELFGRELDDAEYVKRLLLVAMATKAPGSAEEEALVRWAADRVKELRTPADRVKVRKGVRAPKDGSITGPVVIVVGGSDPSVEAQVSGYRDLLLHAFRGYRGTIISGGTVEGVGGLVGAVQERYRRAVRAIGYVPELVPPDAHEDGRYAEIRRSDGHGFTVLEPLQNWIDLVASGIHPSEVKVIGINGGAIAAAEFRLALSLGARVVILEETGREAAKLLSDPDWNESAFLVAMPPQVETLRTYLLSRLPRRAVPGLDRDTRERLAREIHAGYRREQQTLKPATDPSMSEWDLLPENLRESNRQQADYTFTMLHAIGCVAKHVPRGRKARRPRFTPKEIEEMAEMEHERWNMERIFDGWTWSKDRDVANKTTPYLVLWSDLAEAVKKWDRDTVKKIPENLAKVDLEARRSRGAR